MNRLKILCRWCHENCTIIKIKCKTLLLWNKLCWQTNNRYHGHTKMRDDVLNPFALFKITLSSGFYCIILFFHHTFIMHPWSKLYYRFQGSFRSVAVPEVFQVVSGSFRGVSGVFQRVTSAYQRFSGFQGTSEAFHRFIQDAHDYRRLQKVAVGSYRGVQGCSTGFPGNFSSGFQGAFQGFHGWSKGNSWGFAEFSVAFQ